MLMTEWKMEDALDFRYNEGIGVGREEGQDYVLELLNKGFSVEEIKKRLSSDKKTRRDLPFKGTKYTDDGMEKRCGFQCAFG